MATRKTNYMMALYNSIRYQSTDKSWPVLISMVKQEFLPLIQRDTNFINYFRPEIRDMILEHFMAEFVRSCLFPNPPRYYFGEPVSMTTVRPAGEPINPDSTSDKSNVQQITTGGKKVVDSLADGKIAQNLVALWQLQTDLFGPARQQLLELYRPKLVADLSWVASRKFPQLHLQDNQLPQVLAADLNAYISQYVPNRIIGLRWVCNPSNGGYLLSWQILPPVPADLFQVEFRYCSRAELDQLYLTCAPNDNKSIPTIQGGFV